MAWNLENPTISLIIPVYRPGADLAKKLQAIVDFGLNTPTTYELILVDDGSQDGTTEIILEFAKINPAIKFVQHEKNLGKGRTVADGVAVAQGEIVAFTDIDLPYDLKILEEMWARFQADQRIHFLVGSRRQANSTTQVPYPLTRRVASWAFTKLANFLAPSVTDVQCGIKAFRRDVARLLFSDLTISRFAFDVELFVRARKFELQFAELPVVFRHTTHSTVKIVPATVIMFKDLLRIYAKYRRAKKT